MHQVIGHAVKISVEADVVIDVDADARPHAQIERLDRILFDVFAREEFRVLREIRGVPDSTMQIDDGGHDKLAGQADFLGSGWHPDLRRWSHPADPAVIDRLSKHAPPAGARCRRSE